MLKQARWLRLSQHSICGPPSCPVFCLLALCLHMLMRWQLTYAQQHCDGVRTMASIYATCDDSGLHVDAMRRCMQVVPFCCVRLQEAMQTSAMAADHDLI